MIIQLDFDTVSFVVSWAHKMHDFKQLNSAQDKWFDKNNTSMNVIIIGKLGEVVAGMELGCAPSFDIYSGGDNGHDLNAWGLSWQVKTSSLPELIFNTKHEFVADAAVLVTHIATKQQVTCDPRFKILGGISRRKFVKCFVEKNYGYGSRFIVGCNELTALSVIKQQQLQI